MQLRRGMIAATVASLSWMATATQAQAAFHLWQINEIFSNASGTVQFIELFDANSGENFVGTSFVNSNSRVRISRRSAHTNQFSRQNISAGDTRLCRLAWRSHARLHHPAELLFGLQDTITFTGSGDSVTFTGAQLPKNGVLSLNANLTTSTNSPKNFHNEQGSVAVPEPSTFVLVGLAGSLFLVRPMRQHAYVLQHGEMPLAAANRTVPCVAVWFEVFGVRLVAAFSRCLSPGFVRDRLDLSRAFREKHMELLRTT